MSKQGHLRKCSHLAGAAPPRQPQLTPSESHQASQEKLETPATSSNAPSTGAGEAQETHSKDPPAPMETGSHGVDDGQSWAKQVKASTDDDFQRNRPAKHCQSQSRRRGERPTLLFSLQDDEGRRASTQQLYKNVGEQPWAHHNMATLGIAHLHPELLPHEARSLSNQVLCMIAEYHLTGSAQGLLSLNPVLPEAARDLLPPVEDYVVGGAFQGTRDVRVIDRAKTLRIATWLHHLDMSTAGDAMASETLEVTWHGRGPLLELLLGPMMSPLTFAEVVECVLNENRHRTESSLDDLWGHRAWIREELDDLTEVRQDEANSSS